MIWMVLIGLIILIIISYLIRNWVKHSKNHSQELFLVNEHTSSLAKELVTLLTNKYKLDPYTVHQLSRLKFHELYIHVLRTDILERKEVIDFNKKYHIDPSIFLEEDSSNDYVEDTGEFMEYDNREKGNAS